MRTADVLHRLARLLCWGCLLLGMAVSCEDDEDLVLPPFRFDLCEVTADAQGVITKCQWDDGRVLHASNHYGTSFRPDTLYRVLLGYLLKDNRVAVQQVLPLLSPHPRPMSSEAVRTDPLRLVGIWTSSRYLNLRVGIPRAGTKTHYFAFVDRGIVTLDNGKRSLQLLLHHDAKGDAPYYMEETYLSCPLYSYADRLRPGVDSVVMVVRTLQGESRFAALYP